MIITIDDSFTIEIDGIGNHTLIESLPVQRVDRKNDTRKIYHGYYSNIANALKKYAMIKVLSDSEKSTIDRYISSFNEILNSAMKKILAEVKK
ncbi:hypothetical protein [Paracholeplasma manati]|uniref:DUF5405 domain-containing protein n=1 Tax=Paracholeplasma manati TaxID=591373 RepID=A0ABT2Y5A8_9MOLU|nr:hypothetical protein [Paracholeplasma manati]MCV2231929.1 hypothetical protein [Paracholeplasma manati]MDG0888918.1 hypothetical protein [Paracholeplasma manati]